MEKGKTVVLVRRFLYDLRQIFQILSQFLQYVESKKFKSVRDIYRIPLK